MTENKSDVFGLVGRTLAGKYEVERFVAKGGFGSVYYARHIELDAPVAIKVLMVPDRYEAELRAEFLDGFRLEARTIAALAHPAIARVIDYGSVSIASKEIPWMALDWIEGRTLEADLEARPTGEGRSPVEALDLLRPALDALACAHEVGIAHRDIKPANMMLVKARRGEAGLRVLDFGIAKVMEADEQPGSGQTATQTGASSYSLLYAAPEQLSRARTGPWTDVHALALVLVEMLMGQRAYRGVDSVSIFSDILDRERPTPGRFGVDVGPWEPVLARALSLRPMDRYPNADELLSALESSLSLAEAAWRSSRSRASSMAPAAETAPAGAKRVSPVEAPAERRPPRARWIVPALAALALPLVALGVRAATRSDAPAPATASRPSLAPAPLSAPAPVEPPAAVVAAPPTMTPAPPAAVAAPEALRAHAESNDIGVFHRRGSRARPPVAHVAAAPRPATLSLAPRPPAVVPSIVIE